MTNENNDYTNEASNEGHTYKKGALPFEVKHGFTQIPNAVLRHYLHYPSFNGATVVVYGFILSHYNDAFGYAFPTHIQMALALNITPKTVGNHIKTLSEVGLIEVTKKGRFGNDTYTFNSPYEIAEEFFTKYPRAGERYRELEATLTESKAGKDVRKANLTAKEVEDMTEIDEDLVNWL